LAVAVDGQRRRLPDYVSIQYIEERVVAVDFVIADLGDDVVRL
jgi:hypothetical protein